jgi:hypothetical protein
MNAREGARRMRLAGQWIFLLAVTALILLYAMCMVLKSPLPGFGNLAAIAMTGAALWVAAWIVEGFSQNTR